MVVLELVRGGIEELLDFLELVAVPHGAGPVGPSGAGTRAASPGGFK